MNRALLPDIEKRKVRILGIAPYSGMKIIMEQLAAQRADIDLTVFVGDLEQGVRIALSSVQSDYDVLVSRGGTAKMLKVSKVQLKQKKIKQINQMIILIINLY